jgi:hypothetical protein
LLGALACSGSSLARASEGELVTYVAVLELGSDGVHDGLAKKLGDALRHELAATAGYQVSDARVSLEQLSLVQDCDPEQDSCLGRIAKQLGVGALVHGTLSNEGSGALAQLKLFEQASQTVQRTAMTMFALREASEGDIARKAKVLLNELLGRAGGDPAALTPVSATGVQETPTLRPEDSANEESSSISTRQVAGYALLGGAALSVGLSVLAFVEIDRAQNNESFERYRIAVGASAPMTEDVCDEAEANRQYGIDSRSFDEVKSECSTGRTFEVLQFVFLGAAAVSGGLSAYFLLSEEGPSGERRRVSALDFPVQPVVRRHSAEVRARLRF